MKRFRFNTKVGRSRGIGAYRNKGSDYRELAPKYRTLYESGRTDLISASAHVLDVMTATDGGYMPSARFWDEIRMHPSVWDKAYWMHRDVASWKSEYLNTERVFDYIVDEEGLSFFKEYYTPVYWDTTDISIQKDFGEFANHLMRDAAGLVSMPFRNFALRTLKDKRKVLYARTSWLRTFHSGQCIINYYNIARERNFKKVFKFD